MTHHLADGRAARRRARLARAALLDGRDRDRVRLGHRRAGTRGSPCAERTIPVARALGQRRSHSPPARVVGDDPPAPRSARSARRSCSTRRRGLTATRAHSLLDVHSAVPVHAGLVAYHVARGSIGARSRSASAASRSSTARDTWCGRCIGCFPGSSRPRSGSAISTLPQRYRDRLRRRFGAARPPARPRVGRHLRRDRSRCCAEGLRAAIPLLRRGADALDAIPWVFDAARVRRNLGWALGAQRRPRWRDARASARARRVRAARRRVRSSRARAT